MIRLAIAAMVVLGVVALWLNLRDTSGLPDSLQDFPHAYLAPEDMGYDHDKLVIVRRDGASAHGPVVVDGRELWPAWFHPDPQVVPLRDGKVWLFPMIHRQDVPGPEGTPVPTTPPLPHSGQPLDPAVAAQLRRFLVPEAEERLRRFAAAAP